MVMQVEKELGERRAVGYSGVGFAVGPEICYDSLTSSIEDKNTARDLYTQAAWEVVNENYNVLKGAICNGMGFSTSTPSCSLVQPWRKGIIEPT
jgi:glycerol-3-phosphate O-acyltransferase